MANRSFRAQAYASFFCLLWLGASCGGRAAGTPFAAGATAGGATGGAVAAGGAVSAGSPGEPTAGSGGIDWAACVAGDVCLLLPQTACGIGCEPVPLSRYTLVNQKYENEYYAEQPVPPCISIGCDSVPPGEANIPNYYAVCVSGRCQGFDVRTGPLSACSSDSECYLRSGTSCCGCGSDNPIAVSSKVDVEAAFCGASGACAANCTPGPWSSPVAARCTTGHCRVVDLDPPAVGGAAP